MPLMNRLRGSGLKMRLRHPYDELVDRWLGVRTIGWRPAVGSKDDEDLRVEYLATDYSVLRRVLRRADLGPDDVFIDLGSGLGRAVFVASWLGAGRAVGVEIDGRLVEGARTNAARSRLRAHNIEFVQSGADTYPQDESSVIYMFNPFGVGTMRAVAGRIESALRQRPRDLRVVYLNPVHAAVLDALPCLRRYDQWADRGRGDGLSAIMWRSG